MGPQLSEIQKIGIGLLLFGIAFLTFGVLLLFDKGLLAIGNLLLLSGLVLSIGLDRTFRFFRQSSNLKPACILFVGITILLMGWPIVGMILELYSLVRLFGGFMPVLLNYMRCLPVIGYILMLPGIKQVTDSICPPRSMV